MAPIGSGGVVVTFDKDDRAFAVIATDQVQATALAKDLARSVPWQTLWGAPRSPGT